MEWRVSSPSDGGTRVADRVPMLERLTYVSSAISMHPQHLAEIITTARAHNGRHDITGLLLFNGLNFLQTLEGDAATVGTLMERIAADPRHSGVVVVAKEAVVERAFDGWSMAYVRLGPDGGAIGDGEGAVYNLSTLQPRLARLYGRFMHLAVP